MDRYFRQRVSFFFASELSGPKTYFETKIQLRRLFGVGYGLYLAVDFALVMDVLPRKEDRARDLAVWHQVCHAWIM